MKLYLNFSPHAYKAWLMTFEPNTTVGAVPSEYDNPLAHFISFETILAQEVLLDGVAMYLATGELYAVLAVHSELFVLGSKANTDSPSHQDVRGGTRDVHVGLPPWTADLVGQYMRGAPWYAKRPQRAGPSHANQYANQSPMLSRDPVIRPMSAVQASDDLERLAAAARETPTSNEDDQTMSAQEHHQTDHHEMSTLQFEVDLPENEYRAWLQQHESETTSLHPGAMSSATSACAGLESLIQQHLGNEYAVQVYHEEGISKLDVGVLTVDYGRPNEWGELRPNGYGYEFITFILPEWTVSVFDSFHP